MYDYSSYEHLIIEVKDGVALLTINRHPWLVGQPFRIGYLEDALGYMMGHDGVWAASGSEIIDWYRDNPPA